MKRINRTKVLLIFSPITIVVALIFVGMTTGQRDKLVSTTVDDRKQSPRDPCWFMKLTDNSVTYQMIKEKQDRDMYGYAKDISLKEAIKVFNEERLCSRSLAQYPELTEDEVVAAIVAGPDPGKEGEVWKTQKNVLWKIAADKVLPKGSLIVAENGTNVQESPLRPNGTVTAEGIRITLLIGLENHQYGQVARPSQTLVVRKGFLRVNTVK